jgi:hypothetical protein
MNRKVAKCAKGRHKEKKYFTNCRNLDTNSPICKTLTPSGNKYQLLLHEVADSFDLLSEVLSLSKGQQQIKKINILALLAS